MQEACSPVWISRRGATAGVGLAQLKGKPHTRTSHMLVPTVLAICVLGWIPTATAQQDDDLNVYMMESTVKLQGKNSLGTGFMLLRPFQTQSGPQGSISGKVVLITAAHVLDEIPEGEITVVMHLLSPSGDWVRHESKLQIRRNGQPLWRKNREADVAVMYVGPDISPFRKAPTIDLLANDELLGVCRR